MIVYPKALLNCISKRARPAGKEEKRGDIDQFENLKMWEFKNVAVCTQQKERQTADECEKCGNAKNVEDII